MGEFMNSLPCGLFMMNVCNRILIANTLGVVAIASLSSQSAHAASLTYNMQFFDRAGAAIGTGEFTYDPDLVLTISIPPPLSPSFTITNVLTNFLATVEGSVWQTSRSPQLWIDPVTSELRELSPLRSPPSVLVAPTWGFGNNLIGYPVLQLRGSGGQPTSPTPPSTYQGTFLQSVGSRVFDGTWTASALRQGATCH